MTLCIKRTKLFVLAPLRTLLQQRVNGEHNVTPPSSVWCRPALAATFRKHCLTFCHLEVHKSHERRRCLCGVTNPSHGDLC